MHALHLWLAAGDPAHWKLALWGLYAVAVFVLLKIPKVKANTPVEMVFNYINPIALPIVGKIPVFGQLFVLLLGTLDTPQPKPSILPPEQK